MKQILVMGLLLLLCCSVAAMGGMGPAWTRGEMEKPEGEKDMGSFKALVYTKEQQARLAVDEFGTAIVAPRDDATVYVIEQTQCAEATLPAVLATVVEQALHAQVGTCADQGYSMSEGSKTVTLPGGLGDVTLSLFKKASASLAIPSYGEDQPFPELGLQLGMVEQPTPESGDHHQQHEHGHGQHHHHDHEDSDHHHHGYDGSEHRQHGHGHVHDDRQGANAHGNAHGDCPFKKCFRLAKDLCHLSRHQHHEKIQCLKDHAAELPADCQLVVAVKESCHEDQHRLCAGKHRREKFECTMANFAALSAPCQSALTTLHSAMHSAQVVGAAQAMSMPMALVSYHASPSSRNSLPVSSIIGVVALVCGFAAVAFGVAAVVVRRARRNVELSPMSAVVIGQVALGDVVAV